MTQQEKDIKEFVEAFPFTSYLQGKSVLITGATGLIGSSIVKCLLALNAGMDIVIPVRNIAKAARIFGEQLGSLRVVEVDSLETWTKQVKEAFHYIIHCASPTSGKFMEEYPVETFCLAYETTLNLLKLAHETHVEGMTYISSLEYYGQVLDDKVITEDSQGYVDATSARSSYPLGKRAAEYLCFAFAKEYAVPVKVARLTQTFGAGVAMEDNRVFAQFARSSIESRDIILHTTGDSAKPYCYTTDAVSAILYILLKGGYGEAYNVANEETYVSIREMAELVKDVFNPNIQVRMELNDSMGYAPVTKLRLSAQKLRSLGWQPCYDLREMFWRLIEGMRN